ncbi:ankyrin repeat domain-containing protein 26-like [Bos taurus]|uniref:ankyrin repeat domain-containing protein 26-like n=1 Tax=Bos taurus TaxID=9913 RepID=UPI000D5352DF|nr:ankyrin repeat domain-containing protein 26-like [Bos taurus]
MWMFIWSCWSKRKRNIKWTSRRTHERLAVISTKLEVEKQQNRSLFNTVSTRPVLEPPCVGNFNNPLVLNGNLTPRANVRFSTSIPRPSNNSMETYLTKLLLNLNLSPMDCLL